MARTEEVKVFYKSDEAAQLKTVTGWVSRNGRFYGNDEHIARYDGSTHQQCGDCGAEADQLLRWPKRARDAALPRGHPMTTRYPTVTDDPTTASEAMRIYRDFEDAEQAAALAESAKRSRRAVLLAVGGTLEKGKRKAFNALGFACLVLGIGSAAYLVIDATFAYQGSKSRGMRTERIRPFDETGVMDTPTTDR